MKQIKNVENKTKPKICTDIFCHAGYKKVYNKIKMLVNVIDSLFRNTFQKNFYPIETSQLICSQIQID